MTKKQDNVPQKGRRTHKVRCADGKFKVLSMTKALAIKAFCCECLGWETNPRECVCKLCPLFPFRGKTEKVLKGDLDR